MSVGSYTLRGEDCQITIQEKGAAGSTVVGGRVTNFNESGFERNIDYNHTFGTIVPSYGNYSKGEVSFQVLESLDNDSDAIEFFDSLGSGLKSGTTSFELVPNNDKKYKIKLEFVDFANTYGTLSNDDTVLSFIYYNAEGMNIDRTAGGDGVLESTVSFQVAPFNEIGSSNFIEIRKYPSGTVANYNSEESTKDSEMGW